MRGYHKLAVVVLLLLAVCFAAANAALLTWADEENASYRVEINRIAHAIETGAPYTLADYPSILAVERQTGTSDNAAFFTAEGNNLFRYIDGVYYRFTYISIRRPPLLAVNLALGAMAIVVVAVLLYVRQYILRPFHALSEVPLELAKGNLAPQLKESKSRYFGRFLWGVDMLRESMERQREKELALQREKKLLVLSISHDIKTPLSAIKLYAQALSRQLYDSEEKRLAAAEGIDAKANEIERFVAQLMRASSEDFLELEVKVGDFYLAALLRSLTVYYSEKLEQLQTVFTVEPYDDCLLTGDFDCAVQVLQNIMENAIKYGDGTYIRITVVREEECCLLRVTNSGCTLSENELPHIFESFWRGSNVGKQAGNGLGLYICRCLMRKMDGELYAEREESAFAVTAVFRMP